MLGKSHRIVSEAIVASASLATHQSISFTLAVSAGVYFGAKAPDVDQKIKHLGHRTWTHTIWAIIIIFALAAWLPTVYGFDQVITFRALTGVIPIPVVRCIYLGFAIGYLLHIIEDSFSVLGVCWDYPFTKFRWYYHHPYKPGHKHVWNYRTGGKEEAWIRRIGAVVLIADWAVMIIEI